MKILAPEVVGFGIKANKKRSKQTWGNGAILIKSFLMQIKTFESLFCFSQAPTILSHIVPRHSALIG